MAHFINKNLCKLACISAMALTGLSSCIMDDVASCPASPKRQLSFEYTYNSLNSDAFKSEVKYINVYMFDKDGKFIDNRMEQADSFELHHTMDISDLESGKYTFVCLARDEQTPNLTINTDSITEFNFSTLTAGKDTYEDLTERMGNGTALENSTDFAALYTANKMNVTIDEEKSDTTMMSLMKCTKKYRIILVPYGGTQKDFNLNNFEVRIDGSAAYLNYAGDKVSDDPIAYTPYDSEDKSLQTGSTEIEGVEASQALIYDISSSRMFQRQSDTKTRNSEGQIINDKRITITDKRSGKVIFDHSLPWFLGLYNNSTRATSYTDQEYLDRNDYYPLVFYVQEPTSNLAAQVAIHSWRLVLQDTNLGVK